jgi:hypothetical protein
MDKSPINHGNNSNNSSIPPHQMPPAFPPAPGHPANNVRNFNYMANFPVRPPPPAQMKNNFMRPPNNLQPPFVGHPPAIPSYPPPTIEQPPQQMHMPFAGPPAFDFNENKLDQRVARQPQPQQPQQQFMPWDTTAPPPGELE